MHALVRARRLLGTLVVFRMPAPQSVEVKRDCWAFGFVGAAMAVLGGILPISVGGKSIPSAEAWAIGLAPTFVIFGLARVGLSYALYRGFGWTRWPITFWFPVYFITISAIGASRNIETTVFDWMEALIITIIWLFGTWTAFRRADMRTHLQRSA